MAGQPDAVRSELAALAEALKAALAAEGRAGSIDNRITIIASGANSIAGAHSQHRLAAGKILGDGDASAEVPSPLIGQITAQQVHLTQAPKIDVGLVLVVAESQGFLSPEKARALEEQVARTQADLERLRRDNPDWASEIDAAIRAFNASDLAAARDAFARIDALIEDRRVALLAEEATLRLEAARSKHAQATLFYPFEVSKAEPLLRDAAALAEHGHVATESSAGVHGCDSGVSPDDSLPSRRAHRLARDAAGDDATSRPRSTTSATCARPGRPPRRRRGLRRGPDHPPRPRRPRPGQRRLGARRLGQPEQARRRAGRAGRPPRRAARPTTRA